jgi:hypothetical protein
MITIKAINQTCILCGDKADILWPIVDSHIESKPYCKHCLKKESDKITMALKETELLDRPKK